MTDRHNLLLPMSTIQVTRSRSQENVFCTQGTCCFMKRRSRSAISSCQTSKEELSVYERTELGANYRYG